MAKNEIMLKPTYWASVSGGKDSLYMLMLILSDLKRYPLNGVVHFELEIDYPFIHDVIDYMEQKCKENNIPFVRIKPDKTWKELYSKYMFPTRKARWCNSHYKLNAKQKLVSYMKSLGYQTKFYIGYCVDEYSRYEKRQNKNEIYPLVENNIKEDSILEWAKNVEIFNNYYITNRRCGCMWCPLSSYINFAYLYKYYPDKFAEMVELMKDTEMIRSEQLKRPFSVTSSNPKYNADYLVKIVREKWLPKLESIERAYKWQEEHKTLFAKG